MTISPFFKLSLSVLVILAFLARVIFIFFGTDYADYLTSDMGGYWQRALERFSGNECSVNQYAIWPPFFHIVLSWLFRVLDVFGWMKYALEVSLLLGAIIGALSAWFIGVITLRATNSCQMALGTAAFYGLSYPLVYFSAFMLSENLAIPLAILSLFFAIKCNFRGSLISGLALSFAAGVALGFAAGARPPYGIWAMPIFLFMWYSECQVTRKKTSFCRATAFALAFLLCISAISLENRRISSGRVTGLSANGALGLYVGIAKPYLIESFNEGFHYIIIPPQSTPYPERYRLKTFHPMYDQAYFLGLTANYIKRHPAFLLEFPSQLANLFVSPLFPGVGSFWGFAYFFPLWRYLFIMLTLLAVTYPLLRIEKSPIGWLYYSIVLLMLGLHSIFSSEHRYAYGFYFVVVLLCALILCEVKKNRGNFRQFFCVYSLSLLFALLCYFSPRFYRLVVEEKVIRADILKNSTSVADLDQSPQVEHRYTEWFETIAFRNPHAFEHEDRFIGKGLHYDFFVTFRVRADVLKAGNYLFGFYVDDGFRFTVDGQTIAEKAKEGDISSIGKNGQTYLSEGYHEFELKYYQGGGNQFCVASYQLIRPGEESHVIGESSDTIRFRPVNSDT